MLCEAFRESYYVTVFILCNARDTKVNDFIMKLMLC